MKKKNIYFSFALIIILSFFVLSVLPVQAQNNSSEETRTRLHELSKQIQLLQEQLNTLMFNLGLLEKPVEKTFCYEFKHNLRFGDQGEEVEKLQKALKEEGLYNYDITGRFDEKTFVAVTAFQEKYYQDILTHWGLRIGTGFVGQTTRNKLNDLYLCISEPPITTLSMPINMVCKTLSTSQVKFSWSPVLHASEYEVYYCGETPPNETCTPRELITTTKNTSYIVTDLPSFHNTRVRVRACNERGCGEYGAIPTCATFREEQYYQTHYIEDSSCQVQYPYFFDGQWVTIEENMIVFIERGYDSPQTIISLPQKISQIYREELGIHDVQTWMEYIQQPDESGHRTTTGCYEVDSIGNYGGAICEIESICATNFYKNRKYFLDGGPIGSDWEITASIVSESGHISSGPLTTSLTTIDEFFTIAQRVAESFSCAVQLISPPQGEETWNNGDFVNIQWRVQIMDYPTIHHLAGPSSVVLESVTDGQVYKLVSGSWSSSYRWQVGQDEDGREVPAGQYLVKVIVREFGGPEYFDQTQKPITIVNDSSQDSLTVRTPKEGDVWHGTQEIIWQGEPTHDFRIDLTNININRSWVANLKECGSDNIYPIFPGHSSDGLEDLSWVWSVGLTSAGEDIPALGPYLIRVTDCSQGEVAFSGRFMMSRPHLEQ